MERREVLKIGFLAGVNLIFLGCTNKNTINGFLNKNIDSKNDFGSATASNEFLKIRNNKSFIGFTPTELRKTWNIEKNKYFGKALYPDDLLSLGEKSIIPTLRSMALAYGVKGVSNTFVKQKNQYGQNNYAYVTPLERMQRYYASSHTGVRLSKLSNENLSAHPEKIITVNPGQKLTFTKKGYCLDPGIPAPKKGEKFALRPVQEMIPKELHRIYDGIMEASKTNDEIKNNLQDLVWGLRTANKSGETRADVVIDHGYVGLYNKAYPGAAEDFLRYRSKNETNIFSNMTKKIKSRVQNEVKNQIGGTINNNFKKHKSANDLLKQMEKIKPQGTMGDNAQYSTLAPGVVARTEGTGTLEIRSEIVNTSNMPFSFDPTQWSAQSSRDVQSVAIPPFSDSDFTISDTQMKPRDYTEKEKQELMNLVSDQANYLNEKEINGVLDWIGDKTGWDNENLEETISSNYTVGAGAEAFKMAVDMIPGVNVVGASYEAFSGRDWLTGEKLSTAERVVSAIGIVPGAAAVTNIASSSFKAGMSALKNYGGKIGVLKQVTADAVQKTTSSASKQFGEKTLAAMKRFDKPSDSLGALYSYPVDMGKEDFQNSKIYQSVKNDLKKDMKSYFASLQAI